METLAGGEAGRVLIFETQGARRRTQHQRPVCAGPELRHREHLRDVVLIDRERKRVRIVGGQFLRHQFQRFSRGVKVLLEPPTLQCCALGGKHRANRVRLHDDVAGHSIAHQRSRQLRRNRRGWYAFWIFLFLFFACYVMSPTLIQ